MFMMLIALTAMADPKPLTTVDHVDLSRYTGRWYEIARYPNRFEKDCASNVTADYTLQKNGTIEVVNSCVRGNGERKRSKGRAKVADPKTNAKLRVTFFWPFYGDYWVLDLPPDYSYAIVGEPKRQYLWILSRTPQLPPGQYERLLSRVRELGYDPAQLVKTPQDHPAH
jgi:apolipoprotein D and lipocalin family protein